MSRLRHRPAAGGTRVTGTLRWFDRDKGYGFLDRDDGGAAVFVHARALHAGRIAAIAEGDRVSFEIEDDGRGRQRAGYLRLA